MTNGLLTTPMSMFTISKIARVCTNDVNGPTASYVVAVRFQAGIKKPGSWKRFIFKDILLNLLVVVDVVKLDENLSSILEIGIVSSMELSSVFRCCRVPPVAPVTLEVIGPM